MKSLKKYVEKIWSTISRLKQEIPDFLDDSEELVRRCRLKFIRNNGTIHKSAFYFGHPEISVDRSKYRSYKETLKGIPKHDSPEKWGLLKGLVKAVRKTRGVKEVRSSPLENNPAHALIVCESDSDKKRETAEALSKIFQKVPNRFFKES